MKNGIVIIWFCLIFFTVSAYAQNELNIDSINVAKAVIENGDTIANIVLEDVVVFPQLVFKNKRQQRRYTKLMRDVTKAYPYAKYAKVKLDEMEQEFLKLETEKERDRYVETVEDQLMENFSDELKKLTITQGRILLKLIDRETGDTSYELLKQLRGSFSAFFWQAIARLFGSDLKSQYDATGEDALIERVVKMIEAGYIKPDYNVYKRLNLEY